MKKQKAFTLIELMVTISVLGVVLSLAIPSFNKQILNSKSVTMGEDLILLLIWLAMKLLEGRNL